jgi:hypothetical protein
MTLFGADAADYSGFAVSDAGDLNGDGFADVVVGARLADGLGNARVYAGECYVIFGEANLPARVDLENLGARGMTIVGADVADYCGCSVSSAGDVNGDGFDDLLIGAFRSDGPDNDQPELGETYVIFGGTVLPSLIDLNSLGTAGVMIYGADEKDYSGGSVSGAGDVNGDGFDDLLIGAFSGGEEYAGMSYLVLGGAALPSTIHLANLGAGGVAFVGADRYDYSGRSVSGAGDVNGDGFDDLLIGAPRASAAGNSSYNAGECYVVFGRALLPATIDFAIPGSAGVVIYGIDAGDECGSSVSGAGDINGDGYDDLLIGAPAAAGAGNRKPGAGESYVVFGAAALPASIDLVALGGAGITIFGAGSGDLSGQSVSGAGDVNGDGFADFIIGAPDAAAAGNRKMHAGESYLVFGGAALPSKLKVAHLRAAGVRILGMGPGDLSGWSVSGAGDVNGDGFADLLIGAYKADGIRNEKADAGESYILYGSAGRLGHARTESPVELRSDEFRHFDGILTKKCDGLYPVSGACQ